MAILAALTGPFRGSARQPNTAPVTQGAQKNRPLTGLGSPGAYQGFSIMETICTASLLTLSFKAAALLPPISGTKLAVD